jgi:hypothetical protein
MADYLDIISDKISGILSGNQARTCPGRYRNSWEEFRKLILKWDKVGLRKYTAPLITCGPCVYYGKSGLKYVDHLNNAAGQCFVLYDTYTEISAETFLEEDFHLLFDEAVLKTLSGNTGIHIYPLPYLFSERFEVIITIENTLQQEKRELFLEFCRSGKFFQLKKLSTVA